MTPRAARVPVSCADVPVVLAPLERVKDLGRAGDSLFDERVDVDLALGAFADFERLWGLGARREQVLEGFVVDLEVGDPQKVLARGILSPMVSTMRCGATAHLLDVLKHIVDGLMDDARLFGRPHLSASVSPVVAEH
jgi:hypothetical protein